MAPGSETLAAFPFLTPTEFASACCAVADRGRAARQDGSWAAMRLVTQTNNTILKITQCIADVPSEQDPQEQAADAQKSQLQVEDDDPEALIRTHPRPSLQIDYDVLLSPTYQVPVLYFGLRWHHHPGPVGLDAVYQFVVPEQFRKELKIVGVMGGISLGYHPESSAPAFFIHPCNTADAMAKIADARTVTPETYLLIWLGLVGYCVNLHVPRELFAPNGTGQSENTSHMQENVR